MLAGQQQKLEQELQRNAKARGVDQKVLESTTKAVCHASKCLRSVYSKPKGKKMSPERALNFNQHRIQCDEAKQRAI